MKEQTDRSVCI